MIYVALLRGINVGGNNKLEMPKLKKTFELVGCQNVSTYINSGNIIFSDSRTAEQLSEVLEKAIDKEHGLNIRVLIRSQTNISKLCQEIPKDWTNDTMQKTDVMFMWQEVDNPSITKEIIINPKIERVRYFDGALVWNIGRENVAKGSGVKLINTNLYKHMTVRNINTVRKLNELMEKP